VQCPQGQNLSPGHVCRFYPIHGCDPPNGLNGVAASPEEVRAPDSVFEAGTGVRDSDYLDLRLLLRVRSAVLTMRRSCPIVPSKQTISLLVAKFQRGPLRDSRTTAARRHKTYLPQPPWFKRHWESWARSRCPSAPHTAVAVPTQTANAAMRLLNRSDVELREPLRFYMLLKNG